MEFDVPAFMMDGAVEDPTPATLWVSEDNDRLDRELEVLAIGIIQGSAPEPFRDRRLLRIDLADVNAHLDAGGDPAAFAKALVGEAEGIGAILAVPSLDQTLDQEWGLALLRLLHDSLMNGRLALLIGLTDHVGMERLRRSEPRLLAFFTVLDLDSGEGSDPSAAVRVTSDKDLGWVVAVRCQLKAPAPSFDGLRYGHASAGHGAGELLVRAGVTNVVAITRGSASNTLLVSLANNAAGPDDLARAEDIALRAVRRILGRRLENDERMEATRMVCYVASSTV
jgi:hypothetical protein